MTTPANAAQEPVPLRPVDRLVVQVLVDNVTDPLSSNPDNVLSEGECLLRAGMTEWSGEAICCAHFGLSLAVTVFSNGSSHTLLFDAGPEGYAVERNRAKLGLDFGAIEAVVLSHGHWDHAGGLPKALELIRAANGGRDVPFEELRRDRFVIGSPEECFRQLRPYWEELGVTHFVFRTHFIGMPIAHALHSMRMISDKLLPELRKAKARPLA